MNEVTTSRTDMREARGHQQVHLSNSHCGRAFLIYDSERMSGNYEEKTELKREVVERNQ